jgi:predicted molibdopterin-dependent oxidoreductase YjgC
LVEFGAPTRSKTGFQILVSSSRATIEDNFVAQKFARAVLRTNNIDNCFRICHSATAIGLKESLGSGAMTNSIPEFLEPGPGAILLVGSNFKDVRRSGGCRRADQGSR